MFRAIAVTGLIVFASIPAVADDVLEDHLQTLSNYQFGDSRKALSSIEAIVRESLDHPRTKRDVARRLAAVLDSDATLDAKQFVCRQLWIVGGDAEVSALAPLLERDETADMARYALQRIDGDKAAKALRSALDNTTGALRIGIVNSIGARRDAKAVDALSNLFTNTDAGTSVAAASALGKIGGKPSAAAIAVALPGTDGAVRTALLDAYLEAADDARARGRLAHAAEMYRNVMRDTVPTAPIHTAAFIGLLQTLGDDGIHEVTAALRSDGPLAASALAFVQRIEGKNATAAFVQVLPELDQDDQVLLIHALANRGDRSALDAVRNLAETSEGPVQTAAVRALGHLGDESVVLMLAELAAHAEDERAAAASESLASIPDPAVDRRIQNIIHRQPPPVMLELIAALEARNTAAAAPDLMKLTTHDNDRIRSAAYASLGQLAQPDRLGELIDLLSKAKNEDDRAALQDSIVNVALKVDDPEKRDDTILRKFNESENAADKAALLMALSQLGVESSLAYLRSETQSTTPEIQDAAVRAIASWPNDQAADDALYLIKTTNDETHRLLSFRGYIRMLRMSSDRDAAESLERLAEAAKLAKSDDEKKLVLAGVSDLPDRAALDLVNTFAGNPALAEEVRLAANRIKKRSYVVTASHNPGSAQNAADNNGRSRWDTGQSQTPGQWFQIDLVEPENVAGLVLDTRRSNGDYPRGYEVYVSDDPSKWGEPVASAAQNSERLLDIHFEPTSARYIKIVQTGAAEGNYWSIHELDVNTK